MAEIVPFRRRRQWTRARDYGVPARPRHGRRRGGWSRAARELGPTLWALPLAVFAVLAFAGAPSVASFDLFAPAQAAADPEAARFTRCAGDVFDNCVTDGDTFRYRGEKIRVADINTPETSSPKCAAEAELGARATARFQQLLNAGPFTLEPIDRSHDPYGRALFVVTREGASLGTALVSEGLAEEWRGRRREWC